MKTIPAFLISLAVIAILLIPDGCGTASKTGDAGSVDIGTPDVGIPDGGIADGGAFGFARWMSYYKAQLSGLKMNQIVVLGAHDSASSVVNTDSQPCWGEIRSDPKEHIDGGPTPAQVNNARTQSVQIYDQLQAGVRYLDMRVALQDGGYYSEHMWLAAPFQGDGGILDQIRRFNSENPDEIVIIVTYQSHIYSDTTDGGMATSGQTTDYFNMVNAELPLVTAPQSGTDPMQVTLGDIWAGQGRIIYFGPSNVEPFVWDSDKLDSQWMEDAGTPAELVQDLNQFVIGPWMDAGYPDGGNEKLRILQAMTNDNDKIVNAVATNAVILDQLTTNWAGVTMNVVQVNDTVEAVDAGMMPVLFNRMGLK